MKKKDARKERIDSEQALDLLKGVDSLLVAKGKKLNRFNLKSERPSDEDLLKQIMGPSGNLRAPSLRLGKVFVVGFHPEAYEELF